MSTMAPEDVELLQSAGERIYMDLALVTTRATLFGIFIILSTSAIFSILRRGLKTKAMTVYLLVLVVVIAAYAAYFACGVAVLSGLVRGDLIKNADQTLETRLELADSDILHVNTAQVWLAWNFWIGDAVVVWRAFAVCWKHNKIRYMLIILYACGIALVISAVVMFTMKDLPPVVDITSAEGMLAILGSIYFILVNAIATAIIAFHTYKNHRIYTSGLGKKESKVVKIFTLLTESGVVYCGIQIIMVVMNSLDLTSYSAMDYATRVWSEIAVFASVTYPVAVVLIVNHQLSLAEEPETTENLYTTEPDFQFKQSPTDTKFEV